MVKYRLFTTQTTFNVFILIWKVSFDTLLHLHKNWHDKIAMFRNLHFPVDLHLTILFQMSPQTFACSHRNTVYYFDVRMRTLPPTPLVTHLEKVRFLIPLRELNVRHFFSTSGYSIGRICWRYDIPTIWSLHKIFPKGFSFLLRSRKNKNKTRTQSRQTVIHYSPTGKPSWRICSHPLLFLGPTANMWGIMYVTHVQAFP